MMDDTVTALLDQTSYVLTDDSVTNLYNVQLTQLFLQRRSYVAAQQLPTFYRSLLSQWLAMPKDQTNQSAWAEVLLVVMMSHAKQQATSLKTLLFEDATMSNELTRLSLACVVSTDKSTSEIRAAAWTCVVILLQSVGWEWLWQTKTSVGGGGGSFGGAANLCAMVRLAAGEWKIQLAAYTIATDDNDAQSHSLLVRLVEGCGSVVAEAVRYVIQLA